MQFKVLAVFEMLGTAVAHTLGMADEIGVNVARCRE
jgi:hypothetical protein